MSLDIDAILEVRRCGRDSLDILRRELESRCPYIFDLSVKYSCNRVSFFLENIVEVNEFILSGSLVVKLIFGSKQLSSVFFFDVHFLFNNSGYLLVQYFDLVSEVSLLEFEVFCLSH